MSTSDRGLETRMTRAMTPSHAPFSGASQMMSATMNSFRTIPSRRCGGPSPRFRTPLPGKSGALRRIRAADQPTLLPLEDPDVRLRPGPAVIDAAVVGTEGEHVVGRGGWQPQRNDRARP